MRDVNKSGRSVSGAFRVRFKKSVLFLCAAAFLLTVVFNLFVSQLPVRYTRFDTTNVKLYSISDFTKQVVSGLDEEIQIYLVSQYGKEDGIVKELLSRYADLGDKIKVKQVDPVLQPDFLSRYAESIETNSVIVAGEKRFKIITPAELYVENRSYKGEEGYAHDSYFAGEQEITGAITYVTSDYLPKMYLLSGHGEDQLPAYIGEAIKRENIETAPLNLSALNAVPSDADILFLYAPQRDLLEQEAKMILSYLQGGGKMMIVGGKSLAGASPNLDSVMSYYGVERIEGTVVEGNKNYFLDQYPSYILANIGSHPITQPLINKGYFILSPMAQGLVPTKSYRSGIASSALLFTTDSARSITGAASEGEQAKTVAKGPFTVGLAIEEKAAKGTTRIVWFTSPYLLLDDVNELSSGANCDLFLNSLSWLYDFEEGISIRTKTLNMDYLNIRPNAGLIFGAVITAAVPAVVLALGAVILRRRRKR